MGDISLFDWVHTFTLDQGKGNKYSQIWVIYTVFHSHNKTPSLF